MTSHTGTVSRWLHENGFGFIERVGRKELFCHKSALRIRGRKSLEVGETVEFLVKVDASGREHAAHVHLPSNT
jgi:CspA family cold shock protein